MDFERRPVTSTLTAIFSAVFVAFVLAATIMGLRTNFSYWWGRQQAEQTKNSAQNWTSAQAAFHQEANDVTGFTTKIAAAKQALTDFDKTHPNLTAEDGLTGYTDAQARQGLTSNLAGLQQQCVNTVTEYNTQSQSYLTEDWKDADLPNKLDSSACD